MDDATEITEVTLHIREIHQTYGWKDHVVCFDAELLLFLDNPAIEIRLISFETDYPKESKTAFNSIRDGIATVLTPRGWGALVQVSKLGVHPTDFIPEKFGEYAVIYLEKAITSGVSVISTPQKVYTELKNDRKKTKR